MDVLLEKGADIRKQNQTGKVSSSLVEILLPTDFETVLRADTLDGCRPTWAR